jgi:hypothetical protein
VKVTDEYAAWFTALIKQDLGSAAQVAQAVAALRQLYIDYTADEED